MTNIECPVCKSVITGDVCGKCGYIVNEPFLNSDMVLSELNGMVGQKTVKSIVNELYRKIVEDRIKLRTLPDFIPQMPKLNFIFTGNPGTGKTTIARIIGRVLEQLGVFPPSKGDILTVLSGYDLLTATPANIKNLFTDNIGKVLFIDEAYQLRESPRVIADIILNTELPEYKNHLSIIMAGYPNQMQSLLDANAGLIRRFMVVPFTDYTYEELYEILVSKIDAMDNAIIDSDDCRETGIAYFASLHRGTYFGNTNEAEYLLETLQKNRDNRFVDATPDQQCDRDFARRILPCDFPNSNPTHETYI